MEQELPLTPAMTDYAQSPVFRKGKGTVTSLVIFVLVLCFAAPAFLSFVTILQHRPLGAGAALVWVLFGLAASGLIYRGLRNARLIRRDLARGVYVRWTGPFKTRVTRSGLWSPSQGFVVEAGGRELSSGSGVQHLPPIGFNSGTVDYLPASNTLCEVRNEQGALLWSLFGTTGDSLGPALPPPGGGAARVSGTGSDRRQDRRDLIALLRQKGTDPLKANETHARVSYTTTAGYEFRGAPISHGATVLASASHPNTALLFVKFLASPDGQDKVKEFHFLTSPILAGGSAGLLPPEIARLVEGRYLA